MERQWEIELLRSITAVQEQLIRDVDAKLIFDNLLEHLLRLTRSEYGFIGQIRISDTGAPYLKTHAITDIAWNDETRAFYEEHAARGLEFHNLETLFGAAITSEKPVIANSPATDPRRGGLPPGHPPLRCFLGVPFHRYNQMIGMVGVANRDGGYDEEFVDSMKPFLAVCASTIETFRNRRQRENAERALRDSEQRYRRLVEDQPELLCRFTPDRKLTFVNRAYAEYFGKEVEDCIGLDFLELIPASDHEAVCEHVASMGSTRPVTRYEHQVIGAGGEVRWMQWTDRALFDERGEVVEFQSLGLDISDRKRAEEERLSLEAQLLRVQKLESLGILAGGIAHDFNNLLTGILGNADLASMLLPEQSPATPCLNQIETASRRAAELCSQMLAYSGKGRFTIRSIDISELVREMAQILELSIAKKVQLDLELPEGLPAIAADETQIRQVVMNLITNASDAMGDHTGVIRVRTGTRECDAGYLRDTYLDDDLEAGTYVFTEVADNGCGMDRQTIANIFDPFFSTKFAGRGLGLAAVLGIVRGHSGAIRVDSQPDKGTTMTVLFPASEEPLSSTEKHQPYEVSRKRSGLVLVIDDEEAVRELACRSLAAFGFDVLAANDGRAGLKLFREHHDKITHVILDLTMPELSGDEVLRELRRVPAHPNVIISSGYNEREVTERLRDLEPFGFIKKPYRPLDLLATIDATSVPVGGKSSAS